MTIDKVEVLEHIISEHEVETDPSKTEIISNAHVLEFREKLCSFLMSCSCYRIFKTSFARIAASPYKLGTERVQYEGSEKSNDTFEKLWICLYSTPSICFPKLKKRFVAFVDVSGLVAGASLIRKQER